jgi:hypothetical protein
MVFVTCDLRSNRRCVLQVDRFYVRTSSFAEESGQALSSEWESESFTNCGVYL